MFRKIFLEITSVCNLACPFCSPIRRDNTFLSPDHFQKILTEASCLSQRILLHVKGEPLLHPDFSRLIQLGQQTGARFEITTNGLLLEGKEEALLASSVVQINFSLHALLANEVENLPLKVETVLAFARKAGIVRPDLYINFRFWDMGRPEELPRNPILQKLEDLYGFRLGEVDVRKKKSFLLSGRTYLHFDTEFRWPSMKDPFIGDRGFCYGLRDQIAILSNGVVTPCCLDAEGIIHLGNAFTESLSHIISGRRAENIRQGFSQGFLSEDLCRRCTYIRRFSSRTLKRKRVAHSRPETIIC
ncbi:SPASM domain-containing protein [Desulfobotulus sp. H1]|uniref:SPASM domain-containing protein n=1 Tax=Desulfobotulus pelophilus TaxID=2823377 RepID=A0ABT3ND51_9BACT|nr:radical SAM protein [Desulfobotulus pelophilus]MCW7754877.1 SPASM domain-containing protein [Desulfobotulus pelophilus]